MRAKSVKNGQTFYWELPHWARLPASRHGRTCPVVATALGSELGRAIQTANHLNDALDGWRRGGIGGGLQPAEGSVAWLFIWYRSQKKFTKLKPKTQSDYRKLMEAVADFPMRSGNFGERSAAKVGPEVADQLHDRFLKRGERQAMYMVQVCRLVWNRAGRYSHITGIQKGMNPFAGMGVSYTVDKGNRPTSRSEYLRYWEAARRLGFASMATAAALCFELVQRVSDAFGFPDPESINAAPDRSTEKNRGIKWEGYKPGVSIIVRQSKTSKPLKIPLVDRLADADPFALYPELEDQLAAVRPPSPRGLIVVEERSGKPYKKRRMSTVHRKICDAAGLPKDMTFTGFRHGGATEIGDSGEVDIRPISGHTLLDTTAIYNKVSHEKAVRIATRRREHIAKINAEDSDLSE